MGLLIIKYCPILMELIIYLHAILSYQGIELLIASILVGQGMELRHLKSFVLVAETASFSITASY